VATITADGTPQRWAGGAFQHCAEAGIDMAVVDAGAAELTRRSGIPRTATGSCNVRWTIGATVTETRGATVVAGTATQITRAVVTFTDNDSARELVVHEVGHVLGLTHSTSLADAMHPVPVRHTFSADEEAVLAWLYR
jgi:hypothetical protein